MHGLLLELHALTLVVRSYVLLVLYITLFPGHVGGEKQPVIDCLCLHDHFQKNLGIRLHRRRNQGGSGG